MTRIKFEEASQEAFQAFADEATEAVPGIDLTYYDTPKMGEPYIVVRIPDQEAGSYPLIVDVGDALVVGEGEVHIAEW